MPTELSAPSIGVTAGLARPAAPRVLIADDDPASLRFLGDAMQRLGAHVHTCGDGTEALALARSEPFDLLLLDCRMPGAGARQVLEALREDGAAASNRAAAIATSAEMDASDRQTLLLAGFRGTLTKPCDFDALRALLAMQGQPIPVEALLDDGTALAASGDANIMQALRGLMRQELVTLDRELASLALDPHGLDERLHRLRASCGFCGTTALATQTVTVQQQLKLGHAIQLDTFREVLRDTMAALEHAATP